MNHTGIIRGKIDLHMHTTVSDGTDTPAEILGRVKEAGISLFSVTDHDAIKGGEEIRVLLQPGDPKFLAGVEFSCKDEKGKYHILGYGYDPQAVPVRRAVEAGHGWRMEKLEKRLKALKEKFNMGFEEEDIRTLYELNNPGKPHIGNLMVRYGYADSKEQAIEAYLNQLHVKGMYLRPEEAIRGILDSGGIPVLAHAPFGSGDQYITGKDMEERLVRLTKYGLQGVEAFYSGFAEELRQEMLMFAGRFNLYVTAGSDYHGTNKKVRLGDTGLEAGGMLREELLREEILPEGGLPGELLPERQVSVWPEGLIRFLEAVRNRLV